MRFALARAREKRGARVKERAAEARDLFLHTSLIGQADASVWPPHGTLGLLQLATDGDMDVAIRGDERD